MRVGVGVGVAVGAGDSGVGVVRAVLTTWLVLDGDAVDVGADVVVFVDVGADVVVFVDAGVDGVSEGGDAVPSVPDTVSDAAPVAGSSEAGSALWFRVSVGSGVEVWAGEVEVSVGSGSGAVEVGSDTVGSGTAVLSIGASVVV